MDFQNNVKDEEIKKSWIANIENIEFISNETNDAWCRDHGPAFLINKNGEEPEKAIVDWGYNAGEINILRLI